MSVPDLSFLAPPHQIRDWRLVLLIAAATDAGLLAALPSRADDLAGRLGLDEHAVMVLPEALGRFDVVDRDGDGTYSLGASAPSPQEAAVLYHHARAIGQWSRALDGRVRGEPAPPGLPQHEPERWMDALAVHARRSAPASVDACLDRLPSARSVLDLGGGHGEYALEFSRRGLAVTLQDRPEMVDIAVRCGILEEAGVAVFVGDFFETVATGPYDLVFCSGVTNTFGPERNIQVYERVRPSVVDGGHLVIQTSMRDRQPDAALFGVQMLLVGNGGDDHPESRYRQWLATAGYGTPDVVDIEGDRRTLLFAPVS